MSDYTYTNISYVKNKNTNIRNILFIILALFLILNIISFISGYRNYVLITNTRNQVLPFNKNTVREFNQVSFYSNDDKTLIKGWFFNNDETDKVIIVSHDFLQNRKIFGDKTDTLINTFIEKGYSLLLFDYRGSGNTLNGHYTLGYNESLDLEAAISYTKAFEKKEINIISFGSGSNAILNITDEFAKQLHICIMDNPIIDANDIIKSIANKYSRKTFLFSKLYTKLLIRLSENTGKLKTKIDLENLNIHIVSSQFTTFENNNADMLFNKVKSSNNASLDLASKYETVDKYCLSLLAYFEETDTKN